MRARGAGHPPVQRRQPAAGGHAPGGCAQSTSGGRSAHELPERPDLDQVFDRITANDALAAATCSILSLEVGPLNLNLLGLEVALDDCNNGPVTVDITAIQGGGLLGDLLCSLADLLNGGGSRGRRRVRNGASACREVLAGGVPALQAWRLLGLIAALYKRTATPRARDVAVLQLRAAPSGATSRSDLSSGCSARSSRRQCPWRAPSPCSSLPSSGPRRSAPPLPSRRRCRCRSCRADPR